MATTAEAVEITGHRGASYDAPENTLASVNLAWQRGADSVEIDVFLSKDGRIVAIHDADTKRVAGIPLKVAETELRHLKNLDVGKWKGRQWARQRIPTLEEVLATIPPGKRLLIEVKCKQEIVPELKRVLEACGKAPEQTAIISFDPHVLVAVKKAMPDRRVQWVTGPLPEREKKSNEIKVTLEHVVAAAAGAKFNGISVSRESEIDEKFVKTVHDAGLQLHVWTVNSPREAAKFVRLGVDALTTDRPGYLRKGLR